MRKILFSCLLLFIAFTQSCKKQGGCTDPEAKNYNIAAQVDDGSCKYPKYGCTDRNALNYDPGSDHDNGTCQYPAGYVPGSLSSGNTNTGGGAGGGSGSGSLPQKVQNVLTLKFTGTECTICGGWGANTVETLEDHSPKVKVLQAHVGSGDPMYYYPSFLYSNWPTGGGIPAIYIFDTKVSSGTSSSDYLPIADAVLAQTLLASPSFSLTKTSTKIDVAGKVRFWKDATAGSTYEVRAYLIENNIAGGTGNTSDPDYEQWGNSDPDYIHNQVIRNESSAISLGGDQKTNDLLDFSTSFNIDAAWKSANLDVVIVIFEKVGADYNFVNCN